MKKNGYPILPWFYSAPLGLASSFIAGVVFFILLISSFAQPAFAACTNCTVTEVNGRMVYTFTTGSGTYTPPVGMTRVQYLVVAGGGGGGAWRGGGGGAGGVLQGVLAVAPGVSLDVTVGQGGSGAPGGTNNARGANGENSIFGSITAIGGGGGGIGENSNNAGGSGGSGGGAGGAAFALPPGTGTVGQGFDGGVSFNDGSAVPRAGGGGGGAGQAGGDAADSQGGSGGGGVRSSITGDLKAYGGGGGGSSNSGGSGSGGIGGGGDGNRTGNGFAGEANTGGGGGGAGGGYQSPNSGGNGGSGIVVIRELGEFDNPSIAQTFYLPLPEEQLLQGLQTIYGGATWIPAGVRPVSPVWVYGVITAVSDGTIIYYDQMEDGYETELSNPTSIYEQTSNPSGTQIWGDGDPSNGFPPGIPADLILGDTAIVLTNSIDVQDDPDPDSPLFRGGDKIASNKAIAVTWAGWASQSDTLFAGANEVYDTFSWGTDYRVPVGESIFTDISTAEGEMFEYTGAAIMAGRGGATVNIDLNGNGTVDDTVTLAEGESHLVDGGLQVGARITSDNPVQVDLLTGDRQEGYESRFYRLLPTNLWANSYYTPVSTPETAQGESGLGTTVWLYNPEESDITVTYRRRDGNNLVDQSLTVPAGGYIRQVLTDASGAAFFTTGDPAPFFYALSTTESTGTTVSDDAPGDNRGWDWGFTLVPETSLTPQVLIGLGIGRDPTSSVSPDENGNPVWVTTVGNGNDEATVYVDYQNPTPGSFTDPNGYPYDVSYSIRELEQIKVYNPTGDQTGMQIYTLDSGVKLVAAWGQDVGTASDGEPGIDVGTGIPPLPQFFATKKSALWVDNDGDGFISPGDDLQYEITIENISRVPLDDVTLGDILPDSVDYLPSTTSFIDHESPAVVIPDNAVPPAATIFPLDEGGITLPTTTLPPAETWVVNYEVRIKPFDELPPGTISIANSANVNSLAVDDPIEIEIEEPVYGRIGNFVWWDKNEDGTQDGGEPGFPGITVRLFDGEGNLLEETITDENGIYLFTGILAGDYQVEFSAPGDWDLVFSPRDADGQGLRGVNNSDADTGTGRTAVFTLNAGEPLIQVAAGLYEEDPTAVVMGNVDLAVVSAPDYLQGIGAYDRAREGLLEILRAWDPLAAYNLENAGSNTLLQALNDYLDPDEDGLVVVLRWETLEERGTVGFYAERLQDGVWVRINQEMLPGLIASPMGAEYWLADPGARPGDDYRYRLIEVEARGTTRAYGPFDLGGATASP